MLDDSVVSDPRTPAKNEVADNTKNSAYDYRSANKVAYQKLLQLVDSDDSILDEDSSEITSSEEGSQDVGSRSTHLEVPMRASGPPGVSPTEASDVEEKFERIFRVSREMRDEILVYESILWKFWAKMASKCMENSVKIWILGFRV